jgi:hypothetical protein
LVTIPTKKSLARCARESHATVKFCIRRFAVSSSSAFYWHSKQISGPPLCPIS